MALKNGLFAFVAAEVGLYRRRHLESVLIEPGKVISYHLEIIRTIKILLVLVCFPTVTMPYLIPLSQPS